MPNFEGEKVLEVIEEDYYDGPIARMTVSRFDNDPPVVVVSLFDRFDEPDGSRSVCLDEETLVKYLEALRAHKKG